MVEPDKELEEEPKLQVDNTDVLEVLSSLNLKLSPEGNKVQVDTDSLAHKLESMLNKNEGVIMENELLGIRIVATSRRKDLNEVQKIAHDSFMFMLNKTETKRPLGVG